MEMTKDLDYYTSLPWSFSAERKIDEDGICFLIKVNELKCFSEGETLEKASKNINEALKLHLMDALEKGEVIQEPPKPEEYKGRITYRTSPKKHYQLAKEASRKGITITKLIDRAIDNVLSA